MRTLIARRVATRPALFMALCALAAAPMAARAQADSAQYQVVVNAANPVSALSRNEVSRLFLKKTTVWHDARPVVIVDQRVTAPTRVAFTRDVHGRQVASVTSYWQQMIFAGRAVPPVEKATDADVAAYVAVNPAAIGYVSAGTSLPATVKVVTVTR